MRGTLRAKIGIIFVALAVVMLIHPQVARALPVLFEMGGEKVVRVAEFPHVPANRRVDGTYIDPGVVFKTFSIFFIPLFNYDIRYCGYVGDDSSYLPKVDFELLNKFGLDHGINLPEQPQLPFWYAYGGKLVFVALIGVYALYKWLNKNDGSRTRAQTSEIT